MGNYTQIHPETKKGSKMYYASLANLVYMDDTRGMTLDTKIKNMATRIEQIANNSTSGGQLTGRLQIPALRCTYLSETKDKEKASISITNTPDNNGYWSYFSGNNYSGDTWNIGMRENTFSFNILDHTNDYDGNDRKYYIDIDTAHGITSTNMQLNAKASSASKLHTARSITIGNQSESFNGTADIDFNTESMGVSDKYSSLAGFITAKHDEEIWYRLGYAKSTSTFYGEFVVTHAWTNNKPIYLKFIIGVTAGTASNYKPIEQIYCLPDNGNGIDITKIRVIYPSRNDATANDNIYVDICIKGNSSIVHSDAWMYDIINMKSNSDKNVEWVDSCFMKNPSIPESSFYTTELKVTNSIRKKEFAMEYYNLDMPTEDAVTSDRFVDGIGNISTSRIMPDEGNYSLVSLSTHYPVNDEFVQLAFSSNTENMLYRKKTNTMSSPGSWKMFVTEDNFNAFADDIFANGVGKNCLRYESHYGYFYSIDNCTDLTFKPFNKHYLYPIGIGMTENRNNNHGINIVSPNEADFPHTNANNNSQYRTGIYNKNIEVKNAFDSWSNARRNVMDFTSFVLLSEGLTSTYRDAEPYFKYVKLAASPVSDYIESEDTYSPVDTIYLPARTNGTLQIASSDMRLKDNIEDTEVEALPIVNSIKFRQFDWNNRVDNNHQDIGVVADELENIDSHLVLEGTGGYDKDGEMNVKCVDTFYLMGYYGKAIQELTDIVKQQQKEIEELKKIIKN